MPNDDFELWRNVQAANAPAVSSDDGDGLPPVGALLSVAEVAVLLGVSRGTVYRWIESDPPRLGYFKMATGGVRVSGAHVRAFMVQPETAADIANLRAELDAAGFEGE